MIRSPLLVLAIALLSFFVVVGYRGWRAVPSFALDPPAVFYVALDGSDANAGSIDQPWGTIQHAAEVLQAGETVYIRAGEYAVTQRIQARQSGTEANWITYAAFPGERVIIDAEAIEVAPPSGEPPFAHDQGAFQLENVSYIRVKNLEIINSHNSGFTVRNSHHIELINNKTENTLSPGIGVWNSHHQMIVGNTVVNANAREMLPANFPEFGEMPHEAISLGSVEQFEVAYNLVHDSRKEGIDVKEASRHGTVHHNYVHHVDRQGLYVDSWNDTLEDVEVAHNVVHDCKGTGFALSVEGGALAQAIQVHHNLLYDNWGTGIFFSRWGNDGLRKDIQIYNNTVHHNGYGEPNPGEEFYWMTGGLYLFSDNLQTIDIRDNIFSKNAGFQIGYSDRYLRHHSSITDVFQQQAITIHHNLVFGVNDTQTPIYAGWAPDNYVDIYAINGEPSIRVDPRFVDPESGNFYLRRDSPAIEQGSPVAPTASFRNTMGTYAFGEKEDFWWRIHFPPNFSR